MADGSQVALRECVEWNDAARFARRRRKDAVWHGDAQELCESWGERRELLVSTRYGGHYFGPAHALVALRARHAHMLPRFAAAEDVSQLHRR